MASPRSRLAAWLAVFILTQTAGPAWAEEEVNLTVNGHALTQLFLQKLRANSLRNPGNFAQLGTIADTNELELRADAKPSPRLRARFSGRLWYTPTSGENPYTAFLDELFGEIRFSDNVTLRAGKARLAWGTALAWSPVELFQPVKDPQGLLNQYEGFPQLALEANLPRPDNWPLDSLLLSVLLVPDIPANQPAQLNRTRFAGRIYGSFPGVDLALIAAGGNGFPLRLGGTFSAALFDVVTIYGEGIFRRGSDRPELVPGPLPQLRSRVDDPISMPRIVVGTRYTLPGDVVATVEYYFNGEGYDVRAWDNYLGTIAALGKLAPAIKAGAQPASDGLLQSPVSTPLAYASAALPLTDLRRNYLMLSLNRGNIIEWLTLGARVIVGLDDGSLVAGPMIAASPFDNVRFSLNVLAWRGGGRTEFGEFPISLLGLLATAVYF